MEDLLRPTFYIASVVASAIFHECAHGWIALKLGDPTARDQGRLTWDPRVHVDPFMTLIMPALTYFTMGIAFGGAKPVPIQARNFRHPGLGLAISAAAGPISNLLLAGTALALLALGWAIAPSRIYVDEEDSVTLLATFLAIFIQVNVLLFAFNMLPLPGLDGSRILRFFLPSGGKALLDAIEPFALFLTYLLVVLGVTTVLMPVLVSLWDVLKVVLGEEAKQALLRAVFDR